MKDDKEIDRIAVDLLTKTGGVDYCDPKEFGLALTRLVNQLEAARDDMNRKIQDVKTLEARYIAEGFRDAEAVRIKYTTVGSLPVVTPLITLKTARETGDSR